ncbi:RNA polymerase factor sigma-54 [Eisenibacter elegans]|jgi:RNA polymerase sigma-54 factor|uniref:RNA polymerase factor sigma-54 n=1 Tax=Eisenibacter elegans TaxID=997 RepID=UPI000411E61A|nr:RNA polymerase factor sigma-54 [Eisenibacter elegans]
MSKLGINQTQKLTTTLSPQQIQFIKLLQIPTAELNTRIEEELEINPALEEGKEEEDMADSEYDDDDPLDDYDEYEDNDPLDDISIEDYLNEEELHGYKMHGDGNGQREEEREIPIPSLPTLNEGLLSQLSFLGLDDHHRAIGRQIIGSLDDDGYLRRPLEAIVNDLAFGQNLITTEEEVEEMLKKIQYFDPPGIGARDLRECLLIQLKRKDEDLETNALAIRILDSCFEEFTKKHYDKIKKRVGLDEDQLKAAIGVITKLNPKPGDISTSFARRQYIIPDFILVNNNNKLELSLNSRNAPELKINHTYAEMLDSYSKSVKKDKQTREAVSFVKQKIDAAKWFIDAIKQRQQTLLRTMNAIIEYQYEFFLDGDESKFKPMILKDIADKINMDISTISRVANSKSIQTDFGIYPLKYFFSEGIATDSGEDVSSREVKNALKELVDNEDKRKPLSDDKLEKALQQKGYKIARRTVAKYREQLGIPVARLRKEL